MVDDLSRGRRPLENVAEYVTDANDNVSGLIGRNGKSISSRAISAMVSAYEAQRRQDDQLGPRLLARTGLPVAADVPTITASTTVPSSDADAAALTIWPLGSEIGIDADIALSKKSRKNWVRGHATTLTAYATAAISIKLASALTQYETAGANQIDLVTRYGQDYWTLHTDIELNGDVLFFRTITTAGRYFELYVNDHLVTVAPSTGVTQVDRSYRLNANGYCKIKFGSAAIRRIKLVWLAGTCPASFWIRSTDSIQPLVKEPPRILWIGDSFSTGSTATSISIGLNEWFHAAFGFECDLINTAEGSTSFTKATMNLPGATPVNAQRASIRQQYLLLGRYEPADIIVELIGANDAPSADLPLFYAQLLAHLQEMQTYHPGTPICIFGANSGQANLASGATVALEAQIEAACLAAGGNVQFFPMQTGIDGPFLRGTGRSGATTGDGNSDTYIHSDAVHPTDIGHQATGQMMARRVYDYLRRML